MGKHLYLTFSERLFIQEQMGQNKRICEIAKTLNRSPSTIYHELYKGKNKAGNYEAAIGQHQVKKKVGRSKKGSIIADDLELVNLIDDLYENGLGPSAILRYIDENNLQFKKIPCRNTIRNYLARKE